jgi:hypothetical protein
MNGILTESFSGSFRLGEVFSRSDAHAVEELHEKRLQYHREEKNT